MRFPKIFLAAAFATLACGGCRHLPEAVKYPATPKTNHVDVLHGVSIADPYRWLEDDNAAETKTWVEAQNRVTFAHLEKIPQRAAIRARLEALWNYERYGVPFKEGGRYFFTRNNGLQNQSVLLVAESLEAEPRVLLDPNALSYFYAGLDQKLVGVEGADPIRGVLA